jgi:hypothetical protein
VIHNGQSFDDLLGNRSALTGVSVQTDKPDFRNVHGEVLEWIRKSEEAGKPWVVAVDEPGDAQHALVPDIDDSTHNDARMNGLWGALLGGSAGLEWYFGYKHDHSDLSCQDWSSRDLFWDQCKVALDFFRDNDIPFWNMKNGDDLVSNDEDYCFYKPNEVYIVYLKTGGKTKLNLKEAAGEFKLQWINPRSGQITGDAMEVRSGSSLKLGPPPADSEMDWVVLLKK